MSHLGVVLLLSLLPLRLDFIPTDAVGWIGRGTERTEVEVLQDVTDDLQDPSANSRARECRARRSQSAGHVGGNARRTHGARS